MTSCCRVSTFVVVDSAVADYQILLEGISSDAELLLLHPTEDGVEQITQALAHRRVDQLHILSHGAPGTLQLGNGVLSLANLERYGSRLATWTEALRGAEVFLYGCRVAAGAVGRAFVQKLRALLGSELAASTSLIGSTALGGNWQLDFATAPLTPALFSPTALLAYPHTLPNLVDDTFRFDDVTDTNWRVGVGPIVNPEFPPQSPFLTARGTVTGTIPGSPTGALDVSGEGALRLTNAIPDQAAFVLYDRPINSRDGLTITFELFAYGSSTNPIGADGVSFFLLDGAVTPTEAGGFGGSLGYAQKNGIAPGLAGGYVGIGFDEFGNFSSPTDAPGEPIVRTGGPGQIPDSISIRAGVPTNYAFVTGTSSLPFQIDTPGATTRDAARRTVKVDLTPEGRLTVRIDGNNDGDFLDPGESAANLTNIDIAGINGVAPPSTFKFGFASGTGDFNNIHEIRNLVVSTLNNPPTTVDFGAAIIPSTTALLVGFSATDPDVADGDSVESFTILTLPPATQGLLFVGDPAAGGTPVAAGSTLTPTQIENIFFQAAPGFTGSTFTYTATDTRGASDETPATVTLTAIGRPPIPGNLPPNTASSFLRLPQNTVERVPGLDGTDTDGTVVSFAILSIPPASQGTLFLGNPNQGGVPIAVGRVLTPAELQQVFFRSSSSFTGSRFTYAAIDDQGVADPTPAVVTLDLLSVVAPGGQCEEGRTRVGGEGNNNIRGTQNIDQLTGQGGNDRLSGLECPDVLEGSGGDDNLLGGGAGDRLLGGTGRDRLRGNTGDDVLNMGLGNDRGSGNKGNDVLLGRRGRDTLRGKTGNDELNGGRERDNLLGGANRDILEGQQDNDRLNGENGADRLNGGLGTDRVRGNLKNDFSRGGRGNDTLWGGNGRDTLRGNRGNDKIAGNGQIDRILAGLGDDVITAGAGADRIRTGGGSDRIIYKSANHGVDTIFDFDVARDQIDLRRVFDGSEYGRSDRFGAYVRLVDGSGGTILRVDSNGDAAGGFVRLAILEGVAANSLNPTTNFLV
jgi:Ca2+-binding RTX toxin-like protein